MKKIIKDWKEYGFCHCFGVLHLEIIVWVNLVLSATSLILSIMALTVRLLKQ